MGSLTDLGMIEFSGIIEKFGTKGEKTGWSYIQISSKLILLLNAGTKKSFRVKGFIDRLPIEKLALLPMGDGNFIIPLNLEMRKKLLKGKGDSVNVSIELDLAPLELNAEFTDCLADDKLAYDFFKSLAPGHQRYFSKWIESSKTESTKIHRIAKSMNALGNRLGFGEMLRSFKKMG